MKITAEQYHLAIINSIQEPVLIIDRDFRIVDANKSALEAFGQGDPIIGRSCYEVTHKTSVPCQKDGMCPVRTVFMTGRSVQIMHEHRHADGRVSWEEISASPLKNDQGYVEYVIEELHDLTDALKNRDLVMRLQAEVRTLRGLLSICSHCKRIRNDKGEWESVEAYVERGTEANFTHGICPDCLDEHYPTYIEQKV